MLNGLDLFSGIGGITEGLRRWVTPVAYCERDRYARRQLLERQFYGHIPVAPIWNDVRTLESGMLPLLPDIIYGGFPCQDISAAGNGKGLDGERSGLFFEIARLCRDIRPRFVFLENVPAITLRGLERVCLEFTEMGYDTRWTIVSAAELGAPHLRERWFCLAYADSGGIREQSIAESQRTSPPIAKQPGENVAHAKSVRRERQGELRDERARSELSWSCGNRDVANSESVRRCERRPELRLWRRTPTTSGRSSEMGHSHGEGLQGARDTFETWQALAQHRYSSRREWPPRLPEPTIRRGTHGVCGREHEIKSLGNAVVPLQVEAAFMRLLDSPPEVCK